MVKKKPTHGGARKGAGRNPGSGKKPPTVVIRIPKSILQQVKRLIKKAKHNNNNHPGG